MRPSWEEVSAYAQKCTEVFMYQRCREIPDYQRDEMLQEALIRTWKKYEELDPEAGWKSFISTHCKGAILDYLKRGDGFMEHKTNDTVFKSKVVFTEGGEDKKSGIDTVLGFYGHFNLDEEIEKRKINWDLLSRLAAREDAVFILGKWIMGHSIIQIAEDSEFCRERIGQQINELFERIRNAAQIRDKWLNQIVFALGLSEEVGLPYVDNGWGWEFKPVDFYSCSERTLKNRKFSPQLDLFGAPH